MSQVLSRRQFLRGEFRQDSTTQRPPWSRRPAEFFERCTRCGDCLAVCETGILVRGDGGFPEVRFDHGECTFCAACVERCSTGALVRTGAAPWRLTAVIGADCLAARGVVCQVCGDLCAARALRFPPRLGAASTPVLDGRACTGCGACVAPCPTRAITLTEVS